MSYTPSPRPTFNGAAHIPSEAVTRQLGYVDNGWSFGDREGTQARLLRFVLTRADWEQRRRDDIEITGLPACLPLLGLA